MRVKSRLKTAFVYPLDAIATIGIGCAALTGVISCCEGVRAGYHCLTDTVTITRRKQGRLFKKETVTIRCIDGKVISSN